MPPDQGRLRPHRVVQRERRRPDLLPRHRRPSQGPRRIRLALPLFGELPLHGPGGGRGGDPGAVGLPQRRARGLRQLHGRGQGPSRQERPGHPGGLRSRGGGAGRFPGAAPGPGPGGHRERPARGQTGLGRHRPALHAPRPLPEPQPGPAPGEAGRHRPAARLPAARRHRGDGLARRAALALQPAGHPGGALGRGGGRGRAGRPDQLRLRPRRLQHAAHRPDRRPDGPTSSWSSTSTGPRPASSPGSRPFSTRSARPGPGSAEPRPRLRRARPPRSPSNRSAAGASSCPTSRTTPSPSRAP